MSDCRRIGRSNMGIMMKTVTLNKKQLFEIRRELGEGIVNLLCYGYSKNGLNGPNMKIKKLGVENVGGIPYLELDNLSPYMNIICGENGVGKTNILESIVGCFTTSGDRNLKKRSGSNTGRIELSTTDGNASLVLEGFLPSDHKGESSNLANKHGDTIMYFKTDRVFPYAPLSNLSATPNHHHFHNDVLRGVGLSDIKNWFVHRELLSSKDYASDILKKNIELAKKCFDVFDHHISFHAVDDKFELLVNTRTGVIPYEYLSSGFKSCISILFGIIKEVEYRFTGEEAISASEFGGVVLIDEVELHLHPEWQSKICSALKVIFPEVQFFITTHSPHVIQAAKFDEVVALEKICEGYVTKAVLKRDLPKSTKYGFQGWTVEEILADVMGMKDTRGDVYLKQITAFQNALMNSDRGGAEVAFAELDLMLHPESHVRKMLEIQMTTLE